MKRVYVIIVQDSDTGHEAVQAAFSQIENALSEVERLQEELGDGFVVFSEGVDISDYDGFSSF